MDGLTLLLLNVLLNHCIGNHARTHCKIPPRPQVFAPKLLVQMGMLLIMAGGLSYMAVSDLRLRYG